jgi:hypothetical protein
MSKVRLHLPRVTLDWLNSQPGGCATAVARILKESTGRPGADELPDLRGLGGAPSPEVQELLSVHVMKAHMGDLLSNLARHVGRDQAQALAFARCAPDLSRPILDCWTSVLVDLHALHQEHCTLPGAGAAVSAGPRTSQLEH